MANITVLYNTKLALAQQEKCERVPTAMLAVMLLLVVVEKKNNNSATFSSLHPPLVCNNKGMKEFRG